MFDRLARGWSMARGTFAMMRRYPILAVFPIISGAIFLLIVAPIVLSLLPQLKSMYAVSGPIWQKIGSSDINRIEFYVAAAPVVYALSVIGMFCNVALIHCTLRCYAGEEPSVRAGFAAAKGCLPQILGWALVSLTVGAALTALESFLKDKLGFLGSLIGGLFEFGWAVVTYFVLPVLAAEKLGPIAAVRRSSTIVRSKWGELLAGETCFGLVGFLLFVLAAAIFFAGLALQLSFGVAALGLGPVLMALGALGGIALMVVLPALSTIFQAGVYVYATTGQVPAMLDANLVAGAFQPKK